MAFQTILPTRLREQGLTVETVAGWETRGSSTFSPGGAVCHWTAGPRNATGRPCLNLVTYGRSDLPGPLCNVYLDRNGIAVVVAAGRANHAGTGGWQGLTGNSSVFGTEAEAADQDDWTPAQRLAYPKVNAAFANIGGFNETRVCGHSEWAPDRKVDVNGYPMTEMRAQVRTLLTGGSINPVVEEEPKIKNLIIVKIADGTTFVGDGVHRRRVADMAELQALQYIISLKGGDPTVQTWGDIRVLGLLVA